jgi:hypothetical protein
MYRPVSIFREAENAAHSARVVGALMVFNPYSATSSVG